MTFVVDKDGGGRIRGGSGLFLASVLSVVLASGYLAWVLFFRGEETPPVVTSGPDGATVIVPGGGPLLYVGALPAGLDTTRFQLAPADTPADDVDIAFATSFRGEGMAYRYWTPIVALGTGIDTLSMEQVQGLVSGAITNWSMVGGLPGTVTFIAGGPAGDVALQESLGIPAIRFDNYAALRTAMTLDSGMIAIVPIAEVRANQFAPSMSDIDLLRGRGDSTAWPLIERVTALGNSKRGKEMAEALTTQIVARAPETITVVATGDVLMSRCSLTKIQATGDWAAALRGPVAEYLAAADLALTSLDASIQDISPPLGCVSGTNLTSPAEVIEALTVAGIDEATVATNHVFDCGQQFCGSRGFLRMLELLSAAGIKVVGGGPNLEAALAPATFEVNGVTFGILGFDDIAAQDFEATATDPGTAPLDDDYAEERAAGEPAFYRPADELGIERFKERIRLLKTQVDVVIVQVQSGTEDTHTPTERSIKALRAAADAGADLVVGNQAHWVQAAEVRDDVFIAYALGNFIFDQVHTPEHTQGALLEATFWGKQLVNVRLVPYQIENQYRPTFVSSGTRLKILGDIWDAGAELPEETPE